MKRIPVFGGLLLIISLLVGSCRQTPAIGSETSLLSPLESYVTSRDKTTTWETLDTIGGEGHTTYILRMISQKWLSEEEVKDPVWWHWLTVVVPDSLQSHTGMLFIGGGNRQRKQPEKAGEQFLQTALTTHSIVAELHNVPNQPLEFTGDTFGLRDEDEIVAFGWRKFLEGGARDEDIHWLARMPMTTAVVRAMDVLQEFSVQTLEEPLEKFVVAGGSKRGWTTWTTGVTDDRVIAIIPIVIDMLNVVPSFQHHWRVYGAWAPAVGDYEREGIMDWQGSTEYQRLVDLTEPFSFRNKLTIPKMIINATGDQFFLPDSWQFYWNDLIGEKHLRYVPNSEHSMRETDAWLTLTAFYQMMVDGTARPDFDWKVENGEIHIQTRKEFEPQSLTLWKAYNPTARNFQVDSIGRVYQSSPIEISQDGVYQIKIETPEIGWSAYFVELTFPGKKKEQIALKLSTGVVVLPNVYPFESFTSVQPRGTRLKQAL
jgi:PhoPQ-activated pathogenicity-related protein